jgi:AcrR family transcriptional regulator
MRLANANLILVSAKESFFLSESDSPGRREILRAALTLFVRDGVRETSVRAIAEASGYTNPALFKHFAGKDELATFLFQRAYEWFSGGLQAAIADDRPFRENLRALVARSAALLDEDSEAVLYVQENLRRFWPQVAANLRRRSVVGLVRRLLEAGVREGKVTRDIEVELLVTGIIGTLAQFARALYFGEHGPDAAHWVPSLEKTIERMVRP